MPITDFALHHFTPDTVICDIFKVVAPKMRAAESQQKVPL